MGLSRTRYVIGFSRKCVPLIAAKNSKVATSMTCTTKMVQGPEWYFVNMY
jgi:hypothetical protein